MKAFYKILDLIKKPHMSGHIQTNIENKKSLKKAKIELENMLIYKKKMDNKEKNTLDTNNI